MTSVKKVHVPAGNFVVHNQGPVILQAFLSSCVGVALYDSTNNIGGLSHFLLPEPVTSCGENCAGKYASTGFPLFIESLISQGASRDTLRASVAGGAFSGTLSKQDIDLDIGGRTADTIKSYLKHYNIPVDRCETGGFFTCCLNLDMNTWETSILPFTASGETTEDFTESVPDLESVESMLKSLKPIPQIALKVLRMINDDESPTHELAKLVKKEQVISAEVLKYCNTAVFAGKGRIDTIDDALLIIGQNNLAKIITTVAVKGMFNTNNQGYSLVKGGLYHHAIGVALLSEKIAEKIKLSNPFATYTAGLLHDIGKIALDQFVAARAPLFYRDLQKTTNSSIEIERKYLNTDHTLIGSRLASLWTLPDSIAETISNHHTAESCSDCAQNVFIVALADMLLHMFNAGPSLSRVDLSHFAEMFDSLGLSITDYPEIIDLIPIPTLTTAPEIVL